MFKFPDGKTILAFAKKHRLVLILLGAGLFLLWLPPLRAEQAQSPPVSPETGEVAFDLAAYEAKLAETLAAVSGAGRVSVMLYLKSGSETVYATEEQISEQEGLSRNAEKTYVQIGQSPVVVKRLYPAFGGALIVCDGAQNSVTVWEITKAVSALTGLATDKIAVLPMKTR